MGNAQCQAPCCQVCKRQYQTDSVIPIKGVESFPVVDPDRASPDDESSRRQKRKASERKKPDWKQSDTPRKTKGAPHASESFKQLQKIENREELKFMSERTLAAKVIENLEFDISMVRTTDRASMRKPPRLASKSKGDGEPGFALSFPITFAQAEALRGHYSRYGSSRPLDGRLALALTMHFTQHYRERFPCAVADVNLPARGRIRVVGDTHGQLQDLLLLFHLHGPPTVENVYIINGDVADRGPNACEIFFLLFAYYLADPASLVLNRGNHESEEMNAMEAHSGGGFRDEVLHKYDLETYHCFSAMMRVLPLCSVIGGRVFVVHGGLPGTENLSLEFLRSIEHMNYTLPDSDAEEVREQVWNDLLWSDPMDDDGYKENPRGCGVLFGPDVTADFLRNNPPLKFIVRSHQTPAGQRGYEMQRGDACVTIFSASNYCGTSGNQGAIMEFTAESFPTYVIHEYYAPSLEMIGLMVDSGERDWAEAGKALMDLEQERLEETSRQQELNKLTLLIVEYKPELWECFLDKDNGSNHVDFAGWSSTLAAVLGTDWHWDMAWKTWRLGESDGSVNFLGFLKRFSVVVSQSVVTYFKCKAIVQVYEKLMDSLNGLKETIAAFDADGDGFVDASELRAALRKFDLELTTAQLSSLVHSIFLNAEERGGTPSLPFDDFLGRFTLVYKHAHDMVSVETAANSEQRLVDEVLNKIAHLVASTPEDGGLAFTATKTGDRGSKLSVLKDQSKHSKHSKQPKEDKKLKPKPSAADGVQIARKLEMLFEVSDANQDGKITQNEFVAGILRLDGLTELQLSNGQRIDDTMLRRIARFLDRSGDGSISVLELLDAFTFEENGELGDALADHILTILCRHRQAIRAGALCFDTEHTGIVSRSEFSRVLTALDVALSVPVSRSASPFKKKTQDTYACNEHLLPSQIEHLCNALSQECDVDGTVKSDCVAYEKFFDAFEIVDSENPSVGVKLGRHTS